MTGRRNESSALTWRDGAGAALMIIKFSQLIRRYCEIGSAKVSKARPMRSAGTSSLFWHTAFLGLVGAASSAIELAL
jgi:hypothetical protein